MQGAKGTLHWRAQLQAMPDSGQDVYISPTTLQHCYFFSACCTDTFPVTPAQLMAAKNETDWRRILSRVLQNAKELYILFDAELVTLVGSHHRYQITS